MSMYYFGVAVGAYLILGMTALGVHVYWWSPAVMVAFSVLLDLLGQRITKAIRARRDRKNWVWCDTCGHSYPPESVHARSAKAR